MSDIARLEAIALVRAAAHWDEQAADNVFHKSDDQAALTGALALLVLQFLTDLAGAPQVEVSLDQLVRRIVMDGASHD